MRVAYPQLAVGVARNLAPVHLNKLGRMSKVTSGPGAISVTMPKEVADSDLAYKRSILLP
jgi:hypothetical protein